MGDDPWNRNEGKWPLPSSGVPGQRIAGDQPETPPPPAPQQLRRRGKR